MLLQRVQEEILQGVGRVGIAARHAVESLLSGQHRSLHHGLSVEFAGHRPYIPGDDLRHLDWMVFARTDRYNVKVFEEETHMRATLVVDCSGSMAYGRSGKTKLDYARMLAATLGFIMMGQGDAVGLALVDSKVRELYPPRGTMGAFLNILARLEDTPAGGETSLASVLDSLAERLQRRGFVILITDAFDDVNKVLLSLRHLQHRKQDVMVYMVNDPDEERFSFSGMHEFVGLEGDGSVQLDADRAREYYRKAMAEHKETLAEGCTANGITFESCSTDEDLAMVIVRSLTGPAVNLRRNR
ncbi:MAG: DUF58 domain-containing protein [Planctomycetes bacterium]|nr:DUF58 domain-containing protein [Planctomycetota bacterium]